jgi:hypothetical protein
MRRIFLHAFVAFIATHAGGSAQAQTTLSGNATADNAFYAYVSTDNSVLGTLIARLAIGPRPSVFRQLH